MMQSVNNSFINSINLIFNDYVFNSNWFSSYYYCYFNLEVIFEQKFLVNEYYKMRCVVQTSALK